MADATPTLDAPQVRKVGEKYEIVVDGDGTVAGYTLAIDYEGTDGVAQRIFPHTKMAEEYGGRGLASVLVREALKDSVAAGFRIVPVCPYVKQWTQKHDDVAGDVDQARPEHLQFLEEHARRRSEG